MSTPPEHAVVWAEIPVSDLAKATAFYETVTGWSLVPQEAGPVPNPMAMFTVAEPATGVAGHLYPGRPAGNGGGPTVHLTVAGTVEQAAERCKQAGGTVVGSVVTIAAGRFQYATDPDGNSIGLFEPVA
jgi:predicted enzyme related to lactoylglutathione lyase